MKKSYLKLFLFLISLSIYQHCKAQGENNIWCYADGLGIDFNFTPPDTFTSSMFTNEGCITVCNNQGALLFYSAGHTIWDKNGNAMPNGSGLLGNGPVYSNGPQGSSHQGTIVVQSPVNSNVYFSFCLSAMEEPTDKLWYSVIDLTLNNGLGDVVVGQKNIELYSGVQEEIGCIPSADCEGYWVVIRDKDPQTQLSHNFVSFKVDANGVNTTPVLSPTGNIAGTLKFGPDNRLYNLGWSTGLLIHDFNATNGVVLPPVYFIPPPPNYGMMGIDLEFSPDGTKLYMSSNSASPGFLVQYDLGLLPNEIAVANSRTVLDNTKNAHLRLAPNGKIYIVKPEKAFLDAIEYPNALAPLCTYTQDVVPLPYVNLPLNEFWYLGNQFIVIPKSDTVYTIHDTSLCNVANIDLTLSVPTANSHLWSTGSQANAININEVGTYWVVSRKVCGIYIDTFHVKSVDFDAGSLPPDTSICSGDTIVLYAIGNSPHVWQNGSSENAFVVRGPGIYYITYEKEGCVKSDTIHIDLIATGLVILEPDTAICKGTSITLHAIAYPEENYLWNNGSLENSIIVNQAGIYTVSNTNICGQLSKLIEIKTIGCQCEALIPNAFSPNNDGLNDVFNVYLDCEEAQNFVFSVFNRWGERVFQTFTPNKGWDGTQNARSCDPGVYFYQLTYYVKGDRVYHKGDVTLIR